MRAKLSFRPYLARPISFEHLESRICLSGDGAVDAPPPCLLESATRDEAARATRAINCFAFDLYEHFQKEQGNLFFSPLSIAAGLTMTYAGAAGETAAEMEEVLHLGSEAGIHSSYRDLLSSFDESIGGERFQLEVANAIWPRMGLHVRDDFVRTIETDYQGKTQGLDYSNPNQAKDAINSWVEEKTRGKIQDLIDKLSPATAMVLTNSIYFQAFWESPFDPSTTDRWVEPRFYRGDGEAIETSMMYTQATAWRTELDGFQILDMPFESGRASMVVILPQDQNGSNEVTPELLMAIDDWLEGPRESEFLEVTLPKFQSTVSTELKQLLREMGMPLAFGNADFSLMTDASVFIDQVSHKAFLEVNEQGTEAGAATSVVLALCFAAGTPVLTADGEKPIEQLKAGDYVLSRDEHDVEGNIQHKIVEETFRGHADILDLQVGGQGIRVTDAHPFFVKGQGWTPAGELQPGDFLATDVTGRWMEVEKVAKSGTAEPVYNLRVADHHTYFVGGQSWEFAIWTHNLYGTGFYADHPFHFVIRDNASSALLFMGRIDDPSQSENSLTPRGKTQPDLPELPGDANGDGKVTFADLQILTDNFGRNSAVFSQADFNGDGKVDFADFVVLAENYGRSRPLPGDADGDGEVTPADLGILADNFGRDSAIFSDGDFDDDGRVGFKDFVILANNLGRSRSQPVLTTPSHRSNAAGVFRPSPDAGVVDDFFEQLGQLNRHFF